jgi:hypothetical protein
MTTPATTTPATTAPVTTAQATAAPATAASAAAPALPECGCKPQECGPQCARQCWPGEDDWHRAHTRIELPSERYLKAFWHAEILDVDSPNPHDRIIERHDPFLVRFRVELEGRLWRCIGGHWCFNVGFTAIGAGDDFNLSQHLPNPSVLEVPNWTGCETLCVDLPVQVPGDVIPAGYCGTVYEVAAWFELRCCGGCQDPNSHLAASGFERLGDYQFV